VWDASGKNISQGVDPLQTPSFKGNFNLQIGWLLNNATNSISGGDMVILGDEPAGSITNAVDLIAIGDSVMANAGLAESTIAIGESTLSQVDNVYRTVALGRFAGKSISTATNSVFIGEASGPQQNGGVVINSVFIGRNQSGGSSLSNAVAIGASANAAASHQFVLGNAANEVRVPGASVFLGSNYFSGAITGPTNSSGTAPDMSKTSGASLLSTNAAFAWLVPTSVDLTKTCQQWVEILVTNTTASAVAMTVTAPCNSTGTAYVTNVTDVWVMVYPFVITNFYFVPLR
jgi:hypothetical protein